MPKLLKIIFIIYAAFVIAGTSIIVHLIRSANQTKNQIETNLGGDVGLGTLSVFNVVTTKILPRASTWDFGLGSNTSTSSAPFSINISGDDANLLASGSLTIRGLKNCDTIDTDANGLLSCGTDATGTVISYTGLLMHEGAGTTPHITDLTFSPSSFNFSPTASTALLTLDYMNGPASRSLSQTWTGIPYFSAGASFSGTTKFKSSDVTNALTFTPYNATNPSGYITGAQVPVNETDAAHDTCAEITGCVQNAITLNSLSASSPITYNNGTGAFSITTGFTVPPTASISAWEGFYDTPSSRISVTNNLAWSTNTLGVATNYSIPLTASISAHETFYDTPSNRITAGTGFAWSTNTFGAGTDYTMPLTASLTAWEGFRDTPSTRITDGTGLTWSGNTLNVDDSYLLNAGDTATGLMIFSAGASVTGNFDVTGTIVGNLTGAVTGNASTATALAANGANCDVGNYPLGVNASGAVESCTALGSATGADTDIAFVTIGNTASLSFERALTGTANQITVTDDGAGTTVTLSIPTTFIMPGIASVSSKLEIGTGDQFTVLGASGNTTIAGTLGVTGLASFVNASASGDLEVTGTIKGNATTATLATNVDNVCANIPLTGSNLTTKRQFNILPSDDDYTITFVSVTSSGSGALGWNMRTGSATVPTSDVFAVNKSASGSAIVTYTAFADAGIATGEKLDFVVASISNGLNSATIRYCRNRD